MSNLSYRKQIEEYIRAEANPPDKFSHQARLYALTRQVAGEQRYDDDVVHAAVWFHDLGVFIGHRPEEPKALAAWDHVAYARQKVPGILKRFGFPEEKIAAVLEVIRTHMPHTRPTSFEGSLVRDADLLEQLGAVAILRTVSKVGRDTRFVRFSDALRVLKKNVDELPGNFELEVARKLAEPRLRALKAFIAAAEAETGGIEW